MGVLVIDNSHFPAPSHGLGTILYEKDAIEELWEKRPGSRWSRPDLQILTGEGDKAELSGTYAVPIAPGEKYVVGIFEKWVCPPLRPTCPLHWHHNSGARRAENNRSHNRR